MEGGEYSSDGRRSRALGAVGGIDLAIVATSSAGVTEDEDDALAARIRAAAPERETRADLAELACTARIRSLRPGAAQALPEAAGYVVEQCIGEGAFGRVYRARQPRVGHRGVALKQLHATADRGLWRTARVLSEAASLGQLNHPNVVQVYDVVEDAGGTFIAMELVDGASLTRWQQQSRSVEQILTVYLGIAEGIAAAHGAGLLHLDLKPANVLMGRDGRPRVVDFGLARPIDDARRITRRDEESPTMEGSVCATQPSDGPVPRGTIPYSSPEQRRGSGVDERSDQYSFCVALYEALHGRLPFSARELAALRWSAPKHAAPAARGRVPGRVEAALRRGLSTELSARWPSMRALIHELRRPSLLERRSVWAFASAALVATPMLVLRTNDAPESCRDPAEQLVGIWDDDRRDELVRAFGGTPWSDDLGAHLRARLDVVASSWVEDLSATCGELGERDQTPLAWARVDCLQRERARFGQVVGALRHPSAREMENADDAVRILRGADACVDALPVRQAWDSSAVADIDRAQLLLALGDASGARDAAESARQQAFSAGDRSLQAEALLAVAKVDAALDHPRSAIATLEEAAALGIADAREDLAQTAWREAAKIAASRLRDDEIALRWLRLAEASVTRMDDFGRARAETLDARGLYESVRGDDHAAEAAHRGALQLLEPILDDDDPRWADTWLNLAGVASRLGNLDEAESLDRLTVELAERRLGPAHPRVADALVGLAIVQRQRGESRAIETLDRAERIIEAANGLDSIRMAPVLMLRAQIAFERNELGHAKSTAARAWALQREHLPVGHVERAYGGLSILLDVAHAEHDLDAIVEVGRTLSDEALARGDARGAAAADIGIAWALRESGDFDEAEQLYERLRTHPSGDAVVLAYALAGLGAIDLTRERPVRAVERLSQAEAEVRALGQGHDAELAEIARHLADARELVMRTTGG